jgi:ATP-dependent helicase/DNAse subunit B
MPTTVLLGPVGCGKTRELLSILKQTAREHPLAPIWVLLPSRRQEDAFRERLATDPGDTFFNITFFSFYTLYAHLLDIAARPQRQLDSASRLRLIRALLLNLQAQNQLHVFDRIADKPGFVPVIADFIYELKQSRIEPEAFSAAASIGSPTDRDLAAIYTAYQAMLLQNDLVDREGEGWLALDELGRQPVIATDVRLLLADGFDQFNPLQAQLLARLASRARRTLIGLPTVPGRETTIGRRFQEALDQLQAAHQQIGAALTVEPLAAADGVHHRALRHLVETCFTPNNTIPSSEGSIALIEAPDPVLESAVLMRQVKRLLVTSGTLPEDILIAVRDWERYSGPLAQAAQRFGVPAAFHYGGAISAVPVIQTLLRLTELAGLDFRQREVISALRSPYVRADGLSSETVNLLERISRAQQVTGTRGQWVEAIRRAAQTQQTEDGERAQMIDAAQAASLERSLMRFFQAVTPPESGSVAEFVAWIERLIGNDPQADPDEEAEPAADGHSLRLLEAIRAEDAPTEFVSRDLSAMHALKQVLAGLLAAQHLFGALNLAGDDHLTAAEFIYDLRIVLGATAIDNHPNRFGRVLITTVTDARGLPHAHVFVPGLSEGIFPAPVPENVLYLDTEREQLRQRGIHLQTQAERAADEGLFYEVIGLARESLTLSRPTVQNGTLWPESYLWRMVRQTFAESQALIERSRLPLGAVPKAEDAASLEEVLLATAESLNRAELPPASIAVYNWLMTFHPQPWAHIRAMRQMEYRRVSGRPRDSSNGCLSDPRLLNWVAEQLGPRRVWSASQMNDYGMCGFRFFAKRLLKLEPLLEPEEGLDVLQRGTLNHAILEAAYRRLAAENIPLTPDYAETALMILREVAIKQLANAPQQYGFRASALWPQEQQAILRKLETVIQQDFSEDSPVNALSGGLPRQPYRLEQPFGLDPATPLEITLPEPIGGLRVQGYIDRMDRVGDAVVVIDYKTGSTAIPIDEMRDGRNFQMLLYVLAGQRILAADPDPTAPKQIAGGLFWHLGSQSASGKLDLQTEEGQSAVQEGLTHLSEHIRQGRAGIFPAEPGRRVDGACSHLCDYSQLCRVRIRRGW